MFLEFDEQQVVVLLSSADATPLHETRVTLRNPPIVASAPLERADSEPIDHPRLIDEGRLQITGGSNDSRYSSASSTRDLLEHGPEDAVDDCGIVGCAGDIDISIV